jgi:hypothetical protein
MYGLAVCLIFAFAVSGCSRNEETSVQRVNAKLVASTSELSNEVGEAIARNVDAVAGVETCEKHSKNPTFQCREQYVAAARSAARLCGLQAQRAMLFKIMESGGDARGIDSAACDLR